ncbi:MAG TPA: hypothetical protein VJV03_00280, partial [Pyrinomonadaceae bacterium]|nr:hypothetical protein [Pyrinomonadaceae bacterium]
GERSDRVASNRDDGLCIDGAVSSSRTPNQTRNPFEFNTTKATRSQRSPVLLLSTHNVSSGCTPKLNPRMKNVK